MRFNLALPVAAREAPFPWTPLLAEEAGSQAFEKSCNRCLRCRGTDQSIACQEPENHLRAPLNPGLVELNDNPDDFRLCGDRLKPFRRRITNVPFNDKCSPSKLNNSSHRRRDNVYKQNNYQQDNGRFSGRNNSQHSNGTHTADGSALEPHSLGVARRIFHYFNTRQPDHFHSGAQSSTNSTDVGFIALTYLANGSCPRYQQQRLCFCCISPFKWAGCKHCGSGPFPRLLPMPMRTMPPCLPYQ